VAILEWVSRQVAGLSLLYTMLLTHYKGCQYAANVYTIGATTMEIGIQHTVMVASKGSTMSERRALLTDREREIITGEADVKDSYRYQTVSRVRSRLERLESDIEAFREHGGLLEELQEIVCRDMAEAQEGHSTPAEPSPVEDTVSPEPTPEPRENEPAATETDPLDELEFPNGTDQSECKEAIRAARDYIQENDSATKSEIVSAVMPQYPLGYDSDAALAKIEAGDRYRGAWWRKVVKPGLEALDDVAKPPKGHAEWRAQ